MCGLWGEKSGRTSLTTSGMFECEVMTIATCCQVTSAHIHTQTPTHLPTHSHTSSGLLAHLRTLPQSYFQWHALGKKGSVPTDKQLCICQANICINTIPQRNIYIFLWLMSLLIILLICFSQCIYTHIHSCVTLLLSGTWLNMWHGLRRTAGRPEPLSIKYFNTQALLKFIHRRF